MCSGAARSSPWVQRAAIRAAVDPDVVVIGTLLPGLNSEFEAARAVRPLTDRVPVVLLPGNHDTYIQESTPGDSMRNGARPRMGPHTHQLRPRRGAFLVLESCPPLSVGWITEQITAALRTVERRSRRFVCPALPPARPPWRALRTGDPSPQERQGGRGHASADRRCRCRAPRPRAHRFRVDVPTGGTGAHPQPWLQRLRPARPGPHRSLQCLHRRGRLADGRRASALRRRFIPNLGAPMQRAADLLCCIALLGCGSDDSAQTPLLDRPRPSWRQLKTPTTSTSRSRATTGCRPDTPISRATHRP